MNILIYMLDNVKIGTEGTHIFEVLNNLSSMGHFIRYVNGKKYVPVLTREPDLHHKGDHRLSFWIHIKKFMTASSLQGEAMLLLNFLKEIRLFFLALVTVLRDKPDIIYRRHTHFNSDYVISRLFKIPTVKEVNAIGSDEMKITKKADRFTLWLYNIIERYNLPRADRILVVTPELKESLHSEFKVELNKITVIQNGANADIFRPMDVKQAREKLDLNQDAHYICFVGLLERWQGIEYLIKSLPLILDQCPDTRLLIVGDGRIKNDLVTLVEQTGVSSKVIFTGVVPYEEVPLYINAGDVCTAPFIKELNKKGGLCSLKMYEYLACGKPCVISKLRGTETMRENHCLCLVEPENITELAQSIVALLKDRELRIAMGGNGRKYIVESQSWKKVTERVVDVCQNLVKSRRNGNSLV